MRSLKLRLLIALVGLPIAALASIGLAMQQFNRDRLEDSAKFEVVYTLRPGGGLRTIDDEYDFELIRERTGESNQAVRFVPSEGGSFTLDASPEFVAAYNADQKKTIASLNERIAVAIALVSIAAVAVALLFWRRVLGPVNQLTEAARRMEAGDLSQRVAVSNRDEMGQLGNAFNAMAESLQRNEALRKRMTSDVAHELRTPLNNLSGYLDAIADGVVEPGPEVVSSLQEETELLVRLVRDLEHLALADAGQLPLHVELLNLREAVDSAVAVSRPRAMTAGLTIANAGDLNVPAMVDPARLAQVLRNLIENAIRNTPAGGAITVSAERLEHEGRLYVGDTGRGIPEEHLANVFERFYRVDASRNRTTGGAGLGLAIVRQLVEAHGGRVSAATQPGGGSLFTVSFPLAEQEVGSARRRDLLPASALHSGGA